MSKGDQLPCEEEKKWGFVAYNVADAPKCISLCRKRFLHTLIRGDPANEDETLAQICETLSDSKSTRKQLRRRDVKDHPFWHLYCCDAQLCGVNNMERLGEDPNINWIINTCANIGFTSIKDFGPPDTSYTCPREAVHGSNPLCQQLRDTSATSTASSSSHSTEAMAQETMRPSITRGMMSDTSITSVTDPSLSASNAPVDMDKARHEETDRYSTGEKVAIAISVIVGIVILFVALLCLFRIKALRKRRSRPIDPSLISSRSFHPPILSSSTPPPPLQGSSDTSLTPPLRLKERRILPSGLSIHSWTPSAALHHGPGFPENPLRLPMKAKLVPRREEMRKVAEIQAAPLLSNLRWTHEDGSIRSGNSSFTGASSTYSGGSHSERSSVQHIRHPSRVHSLASPGPAPNKKLPPTPSEGVHSRTLSPGRHGDVGVAMGLVGHNPANGVKLSGPSRDLCELTEEYEKEARSSGGSWSGKGGGGPGVAMGSADKKQLEGLKSTLREDDLQKLGGIY